MKRIFLFFFTALSMLVLTTACCKSDDGFNPDDQKKDETQFDGNRKIVVPFFTYGATTYLQQSLDKIYEVTPKSQHLETYTGGDVQAWLRKINISR